MTKKLDKESQDNVKKILDSQQDNVTPIFKPEDKDFMQALRDGAETVAKIAGKRSELNAELAEEMAKFENRGLNRKAVKAAMSYIDMNEAQRENYAAQRH